MKKLNNKIKGFTLIELLVVIAIIGLLASMVLVAVSTARTKAKDARVKAGVQQMRVLAEANASDAGVYSVVSIAAAPGLTLSGDITSQGGTLSQSIAAAGASYCVSSTMPSGTPANFCLDTTGKSGTTACIATGSAGAGACP